MSKLMYGSLSLTKLNEMAKAGHKAFTTGKDGKVYINVNVWINDNTDQYGNNASVQLSFKDATKEDKIYVGNLKFSESREPTQSKSVSSVSVEEIPF